MFSRTFAAASTMFRKTLKNALITVAAQIVAYWLPFAAYSKPFRKYKKLSPMISGYLQNLCQTFGSCFWPSADGFPAVSTMLFARLYPNLYGVYPPLSTIYPAGSGETEPLLGAVSMDCSKKLSPAATAGRSSSPEALKMLIRDYSKTYPVLEIVWKRCPAPAEMF